MFWIKKERENSVVTDFYTEVIAEALRTIGGKVISSYDWDEIILRKNDVVIVITALSALRVKLKGLQYIYWSQGIWPEESYMRHHNHTRLRICGAIEKYALKHAAFVLCTSEIMKRYYEQKYRIDFTGKYYIMPCSNEIIHQDSFDVLQKYQNNVFCYIGGTSVWQCFEETLALYKKIEERQKDAKLLLMIKERDYAEKLISKYGIKNYEIDYVPVEQLQLRINNAKYGFAIRNDDPVNFVATPTKIFTYLANGIVPIYSKSLMAIDLILSETDYKVRYENNENILNILSFMERPIDACRIKDDYMKIYNEYYCKDEHVKKLANIFAHKFAEISM